MEIFFLLVLLAAGGYLLAQSQTKKRQQQVEQRNAVDLVRTATEEDVVKLGEEVVALDYVVAGTDLDEPTRQDYQQALDSYEEAKSALGRVQRVEDVKPVTEALEDGRYRIACVKARVAGEPLPVRRPPCFFNPQHGPSTDDVEWAPAGGIKRGVPACAADAERVRAGAEPITRKVMAQDGTRRPYWEAGPAYGPWAGGYFGAYAMSGLLPAVLVGSMLGGGFGNWDGSYDSGYQDGMDAGGEGGDAGAEGFDGGGGEGYDAGGGDWGGGWGGGGGDSGGGFDGGGFGDF